MSKRRLSDQQTRRINDRQQQRVVRAGVPRTEASVDDDSTLGAEQAGLVLAHFGRRADIEVVDDGNSDDINPAGNQLADIQLADTHQRRVVRCHIRANITALVAGDRVIWRADTAQTDTRAAGVVVACLPRATVLARPDSHSGIPKPVAANVDRIAVVIAPEPQPFANLIDRYLVAAESAGITPFLVLNKADLVTDANRSAITELLEEYRRIGYPVISASAHAPGGLDDLKQHLHGRVSVFVGQSGVGKSSLISTLLPDLDIRVGELSQAESKGRHTTTTARLFHLEGDLAGSDLIDSPGIREFGLDHLQRHQVETGFIELRDWFGRCRFRDCRHQHEPDCALKTAAAEGAISPARLASFQNILATSTEL